MDGATVLSLYGPYSDVLLLAFISSAYIVTIFSFILFKPLLSFTAPFDSTNPDYLLIRLNSPTPTTPD
jgi:hypothetical protein